MATNEVREQPEAGKQPVDGAPAHPRMNKFQMRRAMTLGALGLLLPTVPACCTSPSKMTPIRPSLPVPSTEAAQAMIGEIQPQVEGCSLTRVGRRQFRQDDVNHHAFRTPNDNMNVTVWLYEGGGGDRLMFQADYQTPRWANNTGSANSVAGVVVGFYDNDGTEIGQGTTNEDGLAEVKLPEGTSGPYSVKIVSTDGIRFKFPEETGK